jgi:hypothetical protein
MGSPITPDGSCFDNGAADLILRSRDGVDFRVNKVILAYGSAFFRDFPYELPSSADKKQHELPVVPFLTEDASTVEQLLRIIYPEDPPIITTTAEMRLLLEASRKYQVASPGMRRIEAILLQPCFVKKQPLTAYTLACAYRLEQVARAAAKHALYCRDAWSWHLRDDDTVDLESMNARDLYRLMRYREECAESVCKAMSESSIAAMERTQQHWVWLLPTCECTKIGVDIWAHDRAKPVIRDADWFANYVAQLRASFEKRRWLDENEDYQFLLKACGKAGGACALCSRDGPLHLEQFHSTLTKMISERIAKVCLVHEGR